jgi:prevent-host-death family protein
VEKYEETVSAADANRKFSFILREVQAGYRYTVTSHGRPVARIVPAANDDQGAPGARAALIARLQRQPVVRISRWTRDELYKDGE